MVMVMVKVRVVVRVMVRVVVVVMVRVRIMATIVVVFSSVVVWQFNHTATFMENSIKFSLVVEHGNHRFCICSFTVFDKQVGAVVASSLTTV